MEQHAAHDNDMAARLARLDARRQPAGAAAPRPSAVRTKRRHAAQRSRIGVTIGSVAAMVGLTSYMAMAEPAPASAAVTADASTVTVLTVAPASGVALSVTAATTTTAAPQVTTTTSKGS